MTTLNCKVGDLAIIVSAELPENLGQIVEILGPHNGSPDLTHRGHMWRVRTASGRPTLVYGHRGGESGLRSRCAQGPAPDSCLRPIGKHTQGIDLSYRPHSYFWAETHGIALASRIKGAKRRRVYEEALSRGVVDELPPSFYQHALSAEDRQMLGRLHPTYMGGEYLPNARNGEVEIARITIASTTQDVTCVYARRVGQRINYRVVDEYEGDTLSGRNERTSVRPLALVELVDFFFGAWNLLECLDFNFADSGYDPDEVKGFVISASSSFYAQFDQLVEARIDEWLERVREGRDADELGN